MAPLIARLLVLFALLLSSVHMAEAAEPGVAASADRPAGRIDTGLPDFAIIFATVKNDSGFNAMATRAAEELELEQGVRVRQRLAADHHEIISAITSMINRGVRYIILMGDNYTGPVAEMADRYPLARFTIIDGMLDRPNVRSVVFREEEGAYLAGVLAGMTSKTGKVGFIGGMPVAPLQRFGCGFLQGAEAANPGIAFVSRYVSQQVDGFRNAEKARAVARSVVSDGADVVFVAAGLAGLGALQTVISANRYGIGVDTNQNGLYPGQILTSVTKGVDAAVRRTILDAINGSWSPGLFRMGLAEEAIDWAHDADNAALVGDAATTINAIRADIIAKRLIVAAPEAVPACAELLQPSPRREASNGNPS